jgi:hypothetical protein
MHAEMNYHASMIKIGPLVRLVYHVFSFFFLRPPQLEGPTFDPLLDLLNVHIQ